MTQLAVQQVSDSAVFAPAGASENSPAFQRWVQMAFNQVPNGTADLWRADSGVPAGLGKGLSVSRR